jgi:hypothetical protein
MKTLKTEESKVCYLSEFGHNNFQYPTNKKAILKAGCEYEKLHWAYLSQGLIPIRVNIGCVIPIQFDNDPAYAILKDSSNKIRSIVVWIEKQ